MARTKPSIPQIASIREADETLAEIARLAREINAIESTMNDAIDNAKAAARDAAAPLQLRIKTLGDALGAYATYHKADLFAKAKTISTNHGAYGFRKTTSLKPLAKLTWQSVMEKIQAAGRDGLLRVKTDINKEALRELPEPDMEALGVRLVSTDEFWYEIAQDQVEDVAGV